MASVDGSTRDSSEWALVELVADDDANMFVRDVSTGRIAVHQKSSVLDSCPYDVSHVDRELCDLSMLHRVALYPVCNILNIVHKNKDLYLTIGQKESSPSVLIAMKPSLRILHGSDNGVTYDSPLSWIDFPSLGSSYGCDSDHPHIYSFMKLRLFDLFRSMVSPSPRPLDSIVWIRGHSGSGKTVHFHYALDFLIQTSTLIIAANSEIGRREYEVDDPHYDPWRHKAVEINARNQWSRTYDDLAACIEASRHVKRAFGCCSTAHSSNSTRFLHIASLEYAHPVPSRHCDDDKRSRLLLPDLRSIAFEALLLETSRVHRIPTAAEHNFHIVRQVALAIASDIVDGDGDGQEQRSQLVLCDESSTLSFDIVDARIATSSPSNEVADLSETLRCLRTIGCSSSEVQSILSLIICILYLGNAQSRIEAPSAQLMHPSDSDSAMHRDDTTDMSERVDSSSESASQLPLVMIPTRDKKPKSIFRRLLCGRSNSNSSRGKIPAPTVGQVHARGGIEEERSRSKGSSHGSSCDGQVGKQSVCFPHADRIATLLGVDASDLAALTTRRAALKTADRGAVMVALTVHDVRTNIEGLMRCLYQRLFGFIMSKTNACIQGAVEHVLAATTAFPATGDCLSSSSWRSSSRRGTAHLRLVDSLGFEDMVDGPCSTAQLLRNCSSELMYLRLLEEGCCREAGDSMEELLVSIDQQWRSDSSSPCGDRNDTTTTSLLLLDKIVQSYDSISRCCRDDDYRDAAGGASSTLQSGAVAAAVRRVLPTRFSITHFHHSCCGTWTHQLTGGSSVIAATTTATAPLAASAAASSASSSVTYSIDEFFCPLAASNHAAVQSLLSSSSHVVMLSCPSSLPPRDDGAGSTNGAADTFLTDDAAHTEIYEPTHQQLLDLLSHPQAENLHCDGVSHIICINTTTNRDCSSSSTVKPFDTHFVMQQLHAYSVVPLIASCQEQHLIDEVAARLVAASLDELLHCAVRNEVCSSSPCVLEETSSSSSSSSSELIHEEMLASSAIILEETSSEIILGEVIPMIVMELTFSTLDAGDEETSSDHKLDEETSSDHNLDEETSSDHKLDEETSSDHKLDEETSSDHKLDEETSSDHKLYEETSSDHKLYEETSSDHKLDEETSSDHKLYEETSSDHRLYEETSSDHKLDEENHKLDEETSSDHKLDEETSSDHKLD